jgi:hypothetical protein
LAVWIKYAQDKIWATFARASQAILFLLNSIRCYLKSLISPKKFKLVKQLYQTKWQMPFQLITCWAFCWTHLPCHSTYFIFTSTNGTWHGTTQCSVYELLLEQLFVTGKWILLYILSSNASKSLAFNLNLLVHCLLGLVCRAAQ